MDLKEFLEIHSIRIFGDEQKQRADGEYILKRELGLFFWERGGKQFAKQYGEFNQTKKYAMHQKKCHVDLDARDFLDCLGCLGEEKVKELIKELEKEGKGSVK